MEVINNDKRIFFSRFIISVLIALTAMGSDLALFHPTLTYLKYSVLGIFVLFFFRPIKYYSYAISFIIIIIGFTLLKTWQIDNRSIVELTFMLIAIAPFFVFDFRTINVKTINIIMIVLFFVVYSSQISLKLDLISLLKSETSATETNISAFVFSMLFTYFTIKKNKKWMLINLLMSILAFKRICFLSIIIVYFFNFFSIFKILNKSIYFVVGNLLIVILFSYLASGLFDDLIYESTGLSIGQFTQGRTYFLGILIEEIKSTYVSSLAIGIGQGEVINILNAKLGFYELLHNDIFKLFWESGIIMFVIILNFMYKFNNKVLAFQFNIFMFTDNVLIYTPVLFLFLFLSSKINNLNLKKLV